MHSVQSFQDYHNMAAKLIVTLACFALCNASPAFLKTYIFRDGRSYSVGQGYTNNAGGRATGSATISGGVVKAYGSATTDDHRQLGKNAFGVPGEAVAKAEVYDGPGTPENGGSKAVAEAQSIPHLYPLPAPAIVSYQKNFETPAEIIYEYPGSIAQSSAVINDNSESSVTSAKTEGSGSAEAKIQGVGSYGITSSNAKTFGSGIGTASSKVNNGFGAFNTAARTQGYGSASSKSETGLGSTSAASQTNGGYASSSANNALKSAVVSTSSQGTASSKADINSVPEAVVSSVKAGNAQRTGWRFGTAYSVPTPGQAQVSSQVNGGSAKSTAHTDGVVTAADAQGYGSANANANLHGGYVNSAANTNSLGYGAKYTAGNGYGSAHSTINNGLGNIKSSANSNGYGNANSHADVNEQGSLSSVSNSNGHGTAASSANSAPSYAVFRTDGQYIYNPRASVNTQTFGQGSASAKTQGLNSGYRVVNSVANSFGSGAAQANASA